MEDNSYTETTLDHNGPVTFAGITCLLKKTTYQNSGAAALYLTDVEDDGHVLTVTLNVPGVSETLPEGEVLVKDYSENEGIMELLIDSGYLEATGKEVPAGFTVLTGARLLS